MKRAKLEGNDMNKKLLLLPLILLIMVSIPTVLADEIFVEYEIDNGDISIYTEDEGWVSGVTDGFYAEADKISGWQYVSTDSFELSRGVEIVDGSVGAHTERDRLLALSTYDASLTTDGKGGLYQEYSNSYLHASMDTELWAEDSEYQLYASESVYAFGIFLGCDFDFEIGATGDGDASLFLYLDEDPVFWVLGTEVSGIWGLDAGSANAGFCVDADHRLDLQGFVDVDGATTYFDIDSWGAHLCAGGDGDVSTGGELTGR